MKLLHKNFFLIHMLRNFLFMKSL
ncbi:unnamed protein product [Spirodela intermedia]|uniref:Uncharacterized protein n=1 Tax=Spirodela intermedia TaxID=51605 RepID=A0A7I8L4M0_SPIIN|nr:unnamed protein product [Spirodela intermedia]